MRMHMVLQVPFPAEMSAMSMFASWFIQLKHEHVISCPDSMSFVDVLPSIITEIKKEWSPLAKEYRVRKSLPQFQGQIHFNIWGVVFPSLLGLIHSITSMILISFSHSLADYPLVDRQFKINSSVNKSCRM